MKKPESANESGRSASSKSMIEQVIPGAVLKKFRVSVDRPIAGGPSVTTNAKTQLAVLRRWFLPNPFDVAIQEVASRGERRFLFYWNRGLGDISLSFYGAIHRIRSVIPDAEISVLTRPDLEFGFVMLGGVNILVNPNLRRRIDIKEADLALALNETGHNLSEFDHVFLSLNLQQWFKWQNGKLIPRLKWQAEWDALCERFRFDPDRPLVGVHVQTETQYPFERNWPVEKWRELFERATKEMNAQIVLFGFAPNPPFEGEGIIDLRGKTTLPELLSIIKNRCTQLILPDSGVLCTTYYLDIDWPLKIISLWPDPGFGVLHQRVPSPNPQLRHYPLVATKKDISRIPVDVVLQHLLRDDLPCVTKRF